MHGCHVKPEQMFNLIFGYNAQLLWSLVEGAGANNCTKDGPEVPSDEVWVIEVIAFADSGRALTRVQIRIKEDADTYYLEDNLTTGGAGKFNSTRGPYYLAGGQKLNIYYGGSLTADDVWMILNGYKMKLTQ